jgi:integrase
MRTLRDSRLDTAEARLRLVVRSKPYWRLIEPNLHLGYRRLKGRPGTWVRRRYLGDEKYQHDGIGIADDYDRADGHRVLSFKQAQDQCRGHPTVRIAGPYRVRDAVEDYLTWLAAERKSGTDARRRAESMILPELGDRKCEALTTDELNVWRNNLAKQPPRARSGRNKQHYRAFDRSDPEAVRRRRNTVNRLWTILRGALNHAFRDGKITSDTAWRRVKPFRGADAARVRYLEPADATRLVNACDPDFRLLVQGALQTGCRFSELARLMAGDFHEVSGTVAIRQSKSGKARHVVLTDEGIALFKRLTAGRNDGDLIFQNNGVPWKATQKPMLDACGRARIEPAVSFHIARHTWASLSVMAGMPLMVVARNLGHADTRMVEKHYGHLAPSYVAETVRKHAPRYGYKSDDKVSTIR